METNDVNKNLNQLLPSNILNDIDIDINAEESNQFDEEEEIVDDLAYHIKPGEKPVINQPIRFYSDSNVFLSSKIKKEQPTLVYNQPNNSMRYQMMQSLFLINNQLFSQNTSHPNSFVNHQIYNGMGLPFQNIQVERKRTDPYFINSLTNDLFSTQLNNPTNTSYLSSSSRKKTNSSSNVNVTKTKTSTKSAKESFDSTLMQYGTKLSEMNVEQYEIEDFTNYIDSLHCDLQEFICSQKGSKEMQKYLSKNPAECKTILINILNKNITKVMMDKCGNYFCQQLFQACLSPQLLLLMNYIKNDIVKIAKNSSGTHALQTLIDLFTSEEEQSLILSAIQGHETEMMYDNNATHVLQKLILCINEENRMTFTNVIIANIVPLCYDPNGICVAKKIIKTTFSQGNKLVIIKGITNDCIDIAQNAYGNYAIQYIFEEWNIADYPEMIKLLIDNIELLSIQKFSSNVIEKLIEYLDEPRKYELFNKMFKPVTIIRILKMRYGKYVLQKAIKCMSVKQKKEIKNTLVLVVASTLKEGNKLESFISHFDS